MALITSDKGSTKDPKTTTQRVSIYSYTFLYPGNELTTWKSPLIIIIILDNCVNLHNATADGNWWLGGPVSKWPPVEGSR
jgi:hypothetical protein